MTVKIGLWFGKLKRQPGYAPAQATTALLREHYCYQQIWSATCCVPGRAVNPGAGVWQGAGIKSEPCWGFSSYLERVKPLGSSIPTPALLGNPSFIKSRGSKVWLPGPCPGFLFTTWGLRLGFWPHLFLSPAPVSLLLPLVLVMTLLPWQH